MNSAGAGMAWLRRAWPAFVLPLAFLGALLVVLLGGQTSGDCSGYGPQASRLDGHCVRLAPAH